MYAVLADDTYYYISLVTGEDRSWDGYTPKEEDIVKVSGYVHQDVDVYGEAFHMIDVVTLKPA